MQGAFNFRFGYVPEEVEPLVADFANLLKGMLRRRLLRADNHALLDFGAFGPGPEAHHALGARLRSVPYDRPGDGSRVAPCVGSPYRPQLIDADFARKGVVAKFVEKNE